MQIVNDKIMVDTNLNTTFSELYNLIQNACGIPFTKMCMLNRNEVLTLVEDIQKDVISDTFNNNTERIKYQINHTEDEDKDKNLVKYINDKYDNFVSMFNKYNDQNRDVLNEYFGSLEKKLSLQIDNVISNIRSYTPEQYQELQSNLLSKSVEIDGDQISQDKDKSISFTDVLNDKNNNDMSLSSTSLLKKSDINYLDEKYNINRNNNKEDINLDESIDSTVIYDRLKLTFKNSHLDASNNDLIYSDPDSEYGNDMYFFDTGLYGKEKFIR